MIVSRNVVGGAVDADSDTVVMFSDAIISADTVVVDFEHGVDIMYHAAGAEATSTEPLMMPCLSIDDAVTLALHILTRYAPEKLAEGVVWP